MSDTGGSRRERIAIVGAGLAGLRAAERLRELGFTGELTIVGGEHHPPYHRPALSKQFLLGDLRARDLALPSYVDLDADWRLGTPVQRLDPAERLLYLHGEPPLPYDGLVIATGVRPRALPGAPYRHPRVHMVRTIDDATALQRSLSTSDGACVVVGGGFVACELASTLCELGREVVLVSRARTLLGRVLGPPVGQALAELHRQHGVALHLGTEVRNWVPSGRSIGIHLTNGRFVIAGCVVLAVGGVPETDWLYGSGVDISDGVLCGPTCHVAGVPDVVAAGDVARWPNHRFGRTPRRVEHWLNALEMGRAAAESLLAGSFAATRFQPMPRFWSEQHGERFQAAGMPRLGRRMVRLAGDTRSGAGVIGYFARDTLVGVLGRESPRAMVGWTERLNTSTVPARPTPVRARARVVSRFERDDRAATRRSA